MEEVVVTGKRGGNKAKSRYYVPEIPEDRVGIDTTNVVGQLKSSLWDIFAQSMAGYLSGNEYSEDTFKNIVKQHSLNIPIDLRGDYKVDIGFNKPNPLYDREPVRDVIGFKFKKEF